MTENEKRIRGLGAKTRLLADLKLRAERRLDAAEVELKLLRHENKMLLKALGQMRQALEKTWDNAGGNDDSKTS